MVEAFQWLIEHLSGANWFEHVRTSTATEWKDMSIMLLVFIGIINLANLINLIVAGVQENLRFFPFIPLALGYFIVNNLVNIGVVLIGFSIGGFIGVIITGIIYLILICISAWEDLQDSLPFEGLFRLSAWVVGYSDNYSIFKRYKNEVKKKYNQYLNLEY